MLVDAPVRRRGRVAAFLDTPVPTLLLVFATVPVAFLYPRFGGAQSSKGNDSGGFALTDIVVGGMIIASLIHVLRGDWLARDVWRKILVPILLILVGTLIGSFYSGLRSWVVNALIRDVAAVLTFLCAIDILRRGGERAVRLCYGAVGVAIVLGAVQLATSSGNELRASGTFPNPNVAGNLLAIGLICWSGAPFRWSVKVSVMGVAIIGVLSAGSFGSMIQLGIGFGYLAVMHIDRAKELVRGRRLVAIIPLVLVASLGYFAFSHARGGQAQTGFNSSRFDRSGGLRFSMWEEALQRLPETPWGAGPGSVRGLQLNSQGPDISNEAIQYLVERGVIGLFGLLLLWYALLRLAPSGTAARAIVLAYIFGEIFRETVHYRHLWVFLAIALVSAEIEQRRKPLQELVLT
ncbi:MAG: O-antigen ligase family protein [Acidimicrobiia bacterium]